MNDVARLDSGQSAEDATPLAGITAMPGRSSERHQHNLATDGLRLDSLVGRGVTIDETQCGGVRLCEPFQRDASRPVLGQLVHRGGLRADIVGREAVCVDDPTTALAPEDRG